MNERNSREKQSGGKWNRIFDAVFTIIKYKKSTIDHAIYIRVFYDETVSHIIVSNHGVVNTTNDKTSFNELRIFLKKLLRLKSRKDLSLSI